jgi:hypothetical protein
MTIAQRPARNQADAAPVAGAPDEARKHGLEAVSAARQHAVERFTRLCEEGLRFANRRMDENRRTVHEVAAARTLPDALLIWSRYFEGTTKQYSEELHVLSDLCTHQVWEAVDDLQQGLAAGIEPARVAEPG